MKMPWRTKNATTTSSPTRSAPPVEHHHPHHPSSNNIAGRTTIVTTTTTTPTRTTEPFQNGDSTWTTGTTTAAVVAAAAVSSPTTTLSSSLGSGHYSPIDGSVRQFESSMANKISKIDDAPQQVVTTTTASDSSNAVVASSNTSILLETTSSDSILPPTTLLFEQRSSDDDDCDDIYHTPLQSSMTSLEECHSASNGGGGGSHHVSSFVTTKTVSLKVAESTLTEATSDATLEEEKDDTLLRTGDSSDESPTAFVLPPPPNPLKSPKFLRHASSFLRVSDLIGLDPTMDLSEHSHKSIPNYHCCSDVPPPGVAHDSMEKWVALDDGCGPGMSSSSYTPIAQFAVDALATTALVTMFDATMWVPDSKTTKIIESKPCTSWEATTFSTTASSPTTAKNDNGTTTTSTTTTDKTKLDDHILIWSGNFRHGLYGSDIPAIRSAAVIYMSATQLLHLLMDSNRVKEYNTMSLGRTDLLTLPCRHIVTKVMRSESRPPLLRKTLQFTSIFHARKLNDTDHGIDNENESYLLVTRAVENPTGTMGGDSNNNNNNSGVVVSEILLGVNVIRTIPHHPRACLLLSVNHVRSPLVPSLFLAKRVGLQAATNFVHDLRKCC